MGVWSSKTAAPAAPAAPAIDPSLLAQIQSIASNQKSQAEQILQGLTPPAPVAPPVKPSRWWIWPLVIIAFALLPLLIISIYNLVNPNNRIELFNDYPGTRRSVPSNGVKLPRSMNAPTGLEFSFAWWMVVNDWTYKYGERKHVFTKGDMNKGQQCPSVFLGATENSLEVNVDVFPNKLETIKIDNLPAKKWLHFVVNFKDEKDIEVYVNGRLREARRAGAIIKQNDGTVTVADAGGFDGYLTRFEYYDRALTDDDIARLSSDVPKLQPSPQYATPPYFAKSWWSS